MLNMKKYYRTLLSSNTDLISLIGSANILSAYPQEVKTFPLVVYEDTQQRDIEFTDNLPIGTEARVRIHVFSKTIENYPTTTEIASVIHEIFRNDFWACTFNEETSDVKDNIRHRIMDFKKDILEI